MKLHGNKQKNEDSKVKGVYEKVCGSGEWWIRYALETGRIRREKVGTKSAAINLYHRRKAAVLEDRKLPTTRGNTVTFARIAEDALEYSRAHKKSCKDDEERMDVLIELFGVFPASGLKPQDIERKLKACASERKWKPATFNRYKALLSLAYRIAQENGKVDTNPVRSVRRLPENNGIIRYLTPDEEERLRAVVEPTHPERWAEIVFAMHTGLRAGEQSCLGLSDINELEQQPQAHVRTSKNGSARHVPLDKPALGAIQTLREQRGEIDRLFLVQPYRGWFEIALQAAKVENFTWHCLRHTFASRLVMEGVSLERVAALMGHRTIQMTMRYAHLRQEGLTAAVSRLDKYSVIPTDTKTSTSPTATESKKVIEFRKPLIKQRVTKVRALSTAVSAADS